MAKLRACLTWASVLLGLLSAMLWSFSARVKASIPDPSSTDDGFHGGAILVDGADLVETLKIQAKWNGWAATAATCAALAGAIAQAVPA